METIVKCQIEISNCKALLWESEFFSFDFFHITQNMIAVNVENKNAIKKSNQNNKILFHQREQKSDREREEDGKNDKPKGKNEKNNKKKRTGNEWSIVAMEYIELN